MQSIPCKALGGNSQLRGELMQAGSLLIGRDNLKLHSKTAGSAVGIRICLYLLATSAMTSRLSSAGTSATSSSCCGSGGGRGCAPRDLLAATSTGPDGSASMGSSLDLLFVLTMCTDEGVCRSCSAVGHEAVDRVHHAMRPCCRFVSLTRD